MNISKLKFTKLQMEIFRILCIKTGLKINQTELANFLDVSQTAIAKSIPLLETEKLINIAKGKTNLNLIELNRDCKKTLELKRAENFKIFTEVGIIEYIENIFPVATIVLFGSYSRGDDIHSSDIDIAIIGSKEKKTNLNEFEKMLEKKIIINYYDSLKNINTHLKNNILNGILLSGGFEL